MIAIIEGVSKKKFRGVGVNRFVMTKSATILDNEKITILAGVSYHRPQRNDNVAVTGWVYWVEGGVGFWDCVRFQYKFGKWRDMNRILTPKSEILKMVQPGNSKLKGKQD